MKRSDIEKAAQAFKGDGIDNFRIQNRSTTSPYLWSQKEMIDFAVERVNAALEEAMNEVLGSDTISETRHIIDKLKIGKE